VKTTYEAGGFSGVVFAGVRGCGFGVVFVGANVLLRVFGVELSDKRVGVERLVRELRGVEVFVGVVVFAVVEVAVFAAGRAIVALVPLIGVVMVDLVSLGGGSADFGGGSGVSSCAFDIMVFPSVLHTAVWPSFRSFDVRGRILMQTRMFSSNPLFAIDFPQSLFKPNNFCSDIIIK
jgi:hypothetical protein